MDKSNLKKFFISKGLCRESIYLDAYLELISKNQSTVKSSITQRHHVIPVYYYKHTFNTTTRYEAEKLADADPLNFTVNLTYSDHILAHSYLAISAEASYFLFSNYNMVWRPLRTRIHLSEELINFFESQDFKEHINNMYLETKQFYMTEEIKQKQREGIAKLKASGYLRPKLSSQAKEKIGASKRGKIYVTNSSLTVSKLILPEDLENYLASGWIRGFKVAGIAKKGKPHTEERRKKISTSNIGKNNKAIFCEELNKVYPSVKIAGEALGILPNGISNCLTGRSRTAGGYHWRYVD